MFVKNDMEKLSMLADGIKMKVLAHGEKTLMCEFYIEKGALLPEHSHPYEQTGYLVQGELELYIDGEKHVCLAGDSWSIHMDVKHSAAALSDVKAIEVFSPVRGDYLAL